MDRLPPIPSPPGQHWREFRIRVMPPLMFVVILALVVYIWKEHVSPPAILGEVEAIRANVTVVEPSLLTDLRVDLFQRVQKDDVIGSVLSSDLNATKAELAVIQADLELTRARVMQDEQRNDLSFERLELDWLDQKIRLGQAQINFIQASNDFNRAQALKHNGVNSDAEFERALTLRDVYAAEISNRTEYLEKLEKKLETLRPTKLGNENNPFKAAIEAHEQQILLQSRPILLTSPMDGMISLIYRRPGEKVMPGEPIVTISSLNGGRIIGYIRQPVSFEPQPGMAVEVRSRSGKKNAAIGRITHVGSQMEVINPTLLPNMNRLENGLPIAVTLPPELKLFPGENVSIALRPKLQ
jgi:multidrug resistance efflux pump